EILRDNLIVFCCDSVLPSLLQVSAAGRCVRSPKRQSDAESSSAADCCRRPADPLERISRISCECHLSAGRRRCSASPELAGCDGKENELRTGQDGDRDNSIGDKRESERRDYEERGKMVFFPDDDSNEILPVEQFFGNLDTVQDFPQRSVAAAASPRSHREHRRRHYYAPEDSDDEEACWGDVAAT
uniref:Uncharacterized protein n=1 Tax=Salarias fasciatus TaxID=181472 RepID=A0A672GQD9_SALFA